ncbi:hypothetical protein MESS4_120066 [Mesorhizobium sp. STM 4661]|nr:hypothetical protein MESS4_120066 [Mesorhizobium sp. STM 4661]
MLKKALPDKDFEALAKRIVESLHKQTGAVIRG